MGLGGNDFGGALSDMELGGLAQSVALYAAGAAVASKAGRVLYLDDDTDKRAIAVAMGAETEPLALNADLAARCAALHGVRAFSPGTCHTHKVLPITAAAEEMLEPGPKLVFAAA